MAVPGARTPAAAGGGDAYAEEFEDELPGDGGQEDGEGDAGQTDGGDASSEQPDGQQGQGRQQDLEEDDDLAGFFPAQRTPSRGQDRIQRLANENAELKRQLRDRDARPVQPTQPTQGTGPQIETDEQFQARLALMNPEDRMDAKLDRHLRIAEHRDRVRDFQHAQQRQQDEMARDQRDFNAKAQTDGRYKRWADRVEAKHQEFARGGQFVPREVVFKFLLGDHLLSREGQAEVRRQAARGKERVARQSTPVRNAGSDVGRGRGPANEREARAKRLENLQI